MGVVYKAHDTKLNRTVALKFLPERVSKDADAKARFLQEAQAAAGLNHPNICVVHGVEDIGDSLFMVMEYVDGGELSTKVPFAKSDDAIKVAIQIGEALQQAHAKGIVHRDIKGDNIMFTSAGQAKVMDFGLAKLKGALKLTRTSSTVGTLAYMAPEQVQGGEVDPRSDIFAFGVLLFEMLSGKLPFRGEHEAAMMYSILNEPPEPIQSFLPVASADLAHILTRALEKDPEDRYQSIADMVSELRRLLKHSSRISRASIPVMPASPAPSSATMPASHTPAPAGPMKNRMFIGAGVAIVVLVLAVLAALLLPGSSVEMNPDLTLKVLDVPVPDIDYPGLSGDGNWITFTTQAADGVGRVYLMNTGGGEPRAVVADSGVRYGQADLSFDASKIVYGVFPLDGTRRGIPSVYITSALGSGTRLLADTAILPRWQPDGGRVFFFRFTKATPDGLINICSIAPDGTDERLEVEHALGTTLRDAGRISLSVSYDGRFIAWLRTFVPQGYQEIIVGDRETGEQRQLTHDQKNIDEVCWASNDQIIFSSNRSGNTNVWMIPAGGGEPVQVTKGSGPDLGIRVSKDNSKLLYYVKEQIGNLWSGSMLTGVANQLTTDDKVRSSAELSPDGRQVAYAMQSGDVLNQTRAIYVSNRDGSGRVELTSPGTNFVGNPKWSPDGKRIAYSFQDRNDSTGTAQVFVVEIARPGAPKRAGTGAPMMWLDGDRILLTNIAGSRVATVSSGTDALLYQDSTVGFPVKGETQMFYRDYHAGRLGRRIVRIDKDFNPVGEPRKLMDTPPIAISTTRDYVITLEGQSLWKVTFPSGQKQRIRNTFTGLTDRSGFSFNPGTQEIVYTVLRDRVKLVMMENPFR